MKNQNKNFYFLKVLTRKSLLPGLDYYDPTLRLIPFWLTVFFVLISPTKEETFLTPADKSKVLVKNEAVGKI